MAHPSGRKKALLWAPALAAALAVLATALASFYVAVRYQSRISGVAEAPRAEVAIVFGAGLAARRAPSVLLAQRLDTAIGLYRGGKVQKLLLSGDNADPRHDETRSMRRYATERGVPPQDVVADYAGLSTYDTCYRARTVFGVRSALLVTQGFHLPRALFIANSLGIQAFGVPADPAPTVRRYPVREFLSRALAFAMVIGRTPPERREASGSEPPQAPSGDPRLGH